MGSSGSQPVTQQTTQTKDPWSAAQPHLQNVMGGAANLIGSDVGYQPYTGSTTAGLQPQAMTGMQWMQDIANSEPYGSTNLAQARNLMSQYIANQGMTPGLQTAAGQFGDIYNRALGDQNPYLQAMIDTSNQQIGNRINSSMSGAGRYGSGQHTDVMARALAQSADPILAQDYANRQQLQMQATGELANLYNTAAQRAGSAAQMVPTLDAARFANAGIMQDVGSAYQQQQQAQLDAALKLYNAQQARPWEQLQRYNALVQGAGSLGGTQITSTPGATQPSTTQRLLGGALAGAGLGSAIFPGVGTGIGALGGGLLGLM